MILSCVMGSAFLLSTSKIKFEKEKIKILSEKILSQSNVIGHFDLSSKIELVDDSGQISNFGLVLNGKPKLIFQIADTSNKKVLDSILPKLQDLSKQIGENNIVLLSSSAELLKVQIFCQQFRLRFPLFKINKRGISKADSLKSSSLYIVNPDFKVHHVFTPDVKLPDLNQLYFSQVKDFFKKSG